MATIIYMSEGLKKRWPRPLATEWRRSYPHLFDGDDLRLAFSQPRNHFYEWLAAIHLFHRDGVYALVEKYAYKNHRRKVTTLHKILPKEEDFSFIRALLTMEKVQPPDLLLYTPDHSLSGFAEVKGPTDRLRPEQLASHEKLRDKFGLPVELIEIKVRSPKTLG